MNISHLCLALLTFTAVAFGDGPAATLDARWWSHLPPELPSAWLDEGIRLMEIGAQEESAALLDEAHRRFPKDHALTETFVHFASFTAKPEVTMQRYRDMLDHAPNLHDRLRIARALGWWASSAQLLSDYLDEVRDRIGKEPDNVVPWLLLAALRGGAGNQVNQDECVREAAKAGSRDISVLLELAAFQDEAGMIEELAATLKAMAAIDPSSRAGLKLACQELAHGDAAVGLRMYDQLTGRDAWDVDTLLEGAEALMLVGEWPRIMALLKPQQARHPEDYRLLSMLAISQEEEGLVDEAASSWLAALAIRKEPAGKQPALWLHPWSSASLPKGTDVWKYLGGVSSDAYTHRNRMNWRAEGREIFDQSFKMLPWVVQMVPAYAFAHLRAVAFELTPVARRKLLRSLADLGYADADALLNAPCDSGPRVDGAFLDQHPHNEALFASWYLDKDQFGFGEGGMIVSRMVRTLQGSEPSPSRLEHCFELFRKDYPELALNASLKSLTSERTLQTLPDVIARLGATATRTLIDLDGISAHAVRTQNIVLIKAICARLESWLEQDRIPLSAQARIESLVKRHQSDEPKLQAMLAAIKQRADWSGAARQGRMYFNDTLIGPGDGKGQASTRRSEPKSLNRHDWYVARRKAAEALAHEAEAKLRAKDRAAALNKVRSYLELAADDWLDYARSDASFIRLNGLKYGVAKVDAKLVDEGIELFAKDANPARYAALLEMSGRLDDASTSYQRAYDAGERSPHFLRHRAVFAARTDVQAGLKILREIPPLRLPNCLDCIATDCGPGNGSFNSPTIRLANGRLLTAWLEQRAASHQPLIWSLRIPNALGQMGRGDDRDHEFRDIWRSNDEGKAPYPPELQQAFNALGQALLRFPRTAVTAFAHMLLVARSEGKPLAPFYVQALQLLQDPRITDLDTPDEIRYSQRWSHRPVLLSPAVFATEYAVLSKPPGTFEKDVLPVVLRAFGNDDEMILRAYATMCGSHDDDFVINAQKWLEAKGSNDWRRALFPENRDGERSAFVKRVWTEKKLTVAIDDLLGKQPK